MHRRLPVLLSSLVVGSVALGACTSGSSAPPVQTVPGSNRAVRTGGLGQSARPFEQFGSCEELLGYARAEALERVTPWGFDEGMWFAEDSAGGPATTMAGAPPTPTAAAASEGDRRSSATNTQEAGVDEGDLVETDGRYVYAVENGTLQVVDTTAGKLIGRLDLGAATHQLLLDGSRLTVVTSTWPAMGPMPAGREIWPGPSTASPTTLVRVVDVTDPSIGGDRTQHVLWRIQNGELDGIEPKVVVLMIGTNNARSATPDEIAQGIKAIVEELRQRLPKARILLLGVFPRSQKPDSTRERLKSVNEKIARLDDGSHVKFLDIGKVFLNEDGTISGEIMPDYLHLSRKGYRLWADAMEPTLWSMLDEPR